MSQLSSDLSCLQRHERIVIVTLILGVILTLGLKITAVVDRNAENKLAVVTAQYNASVKESAALAKQVAEDKAQYQQDRQNWLQQEAALTSAINKRGATLVQQQKQDQTLDSKDVIVRWKSFVPTGSITDSPSGVVSDLQASRDTVSLLESVPVLKADNADLQNINKNKDSQIVEVEKINTDLTGQVTGLNVQLKDKEKECSAQVSVIKKKSRISKLRWFAAGAVTTAVLITRYVVF